MRSCRFLSVLFLVLVTILGCSKGGDSNVPKITGSVSLDGQPLADARLSFVPEVADGKREPGGTTTDASGKFEIKPDPRSGQTLKPGRYKVFISKVVKKDGTVAAPEEMGQLEAQGGVKNLVPPKYNNPDFPPQLKAEIKPGDNALPPFELKSK